MSRREKTDTDREGFLRALPFCAPGTADTLQCVRDKGDRT